MPRFMRLRAACHEPQFIRSCAVVHAPARRLTCGRAAAPAIVRRGSCDCALRPFSEEGTKRTNGSAPPARTGGGRALGRGRCCRIVFTAGLGRCARHGGWPKRFLRRGRRGDGSRRAANRSILRRGRARCGCHTARALAACGRPAAWRGVWLARLFRGGAAGGAMGARRGGARLTGLFSWRGGARRGCHTARALAARGRPAAWRGRAVDPNLGAAGRRGDGGAARRRATNRTIFAAGRGGAPGMAAGPSVFCGAAGGAMGARRAVCD